VAAVITAVFLNIPNPARGRPQVIGVQAD